MAARFLWIRRSGVPRGVDRLTDRGMHVCGGDRGVHGRMNAGRRDGARVRGGREAGRVRGVRDRVVHRRMRAGRRVCRRMERKTVTGRVGSRVHAHSVHHPRMHLAEPARA